jgi:hypothetical protein
MTGGVAVPARRLKRDDSALCGRSRPFSGAACSPRERNRSRSVSRSGFDRRSVSPRYRFRRARDIGQDIGSRIRSEQRSGIKRRQ